MGIKYETISTFFAVRKLDGHIFNTAINEHDALVIAALDCDDELFYEDCTDEMIEAVRSTVTVQRRDGVNETFVREFAGVIMVWMVAQVYLGIDSAGSTADYLWGIIDEALSDMGDDPLIGYSPISSVRNSRESEIVETTRKWSKVESYQGPDDVYKEAEGERLYEHLSDLTGKSLVSGMGWG